MTLPKPSRRVERMSKIKEGPGVFVYDGSSECEEHKPAPLVTGKAQPIFTADGMPVMDSSGRQAFERAGRIVVDEKGAPRMGGKPEITRIKMKTRKLWNVEFSAGKEVHVANADLARKLRSMAGFKEVTPKSAPKIDKPV